MDDQTIRLLALIAAAALGIIATLGILRRQRHEAEESIRDSPYATSTDAWSSRGSLRSVPTGWAFQWIDAAPAPWYEFSSVCDRESRTLLRI